ncbi:MAG: 3-oxoacyl-ACP reductase [Spirochaetaceae bacterium]|nr:3-oxoacyl-ACP reductase [Spirochaetaceae bacterium]|tara:strand:+ start:25240 stop:26010 length:771 start_codon:yes stop_codon:yes gene_type:complete
MNLEGKTVLVTGSASGLGYAMIQAFAKKKARVVVSDINQEKVDQALASLKEEGIEALGIPCNVSDEKEVEELFARVVKETHRLDVAVLNAGILRDGKLVSVDRQTGAVKDKMSLAQWQSVIDVNLTGVFLCAREASAAMINLKNPGVIIPISSVARHGNPGQTNYSAAKAGVASMTRLWALELARHSIRVAGVSPGFIATEMVLQVMNQKALEQWQQKIPIGRLGKPEEIADTAVFIAENDLVNGEILEITGGVRV